jgi:pentatricopeptide repeat protein
MYIGAASLINGYCKSRRMNDGKSLLAEMSETELTPNTVTYSTVMQGLCHVGRPQEALKLFKLMCCSSLLPD